MANYDAVVIGSGPNGLAAAVTLAQNGWSVLVKEARSAAGGGMATDEGTLAGFRHDICSAIHPMALLSPFFQGIDLRAHGLEWVYPLASIAHPLDGEPA